MEFGGFGEKCSVSIECRIRLFLPKETEKHICNKSNLGILLEKKVRRLKGHLVVLRSIGIDKL